MKVFGGRKFALFAFAFITSPTNLKKAKYKLDFDSQTFIEAEYSIQKVRNSKFEAAGIVSVLLSILPLLVYYIIGKTNTYIGNNIKAFVSIFVSFIFIFITIGVFLLVNANLRKRALGFFLEIPKSHLEEKTKKSLIICWISLPILFLILSLITKRWDWTWTIFPIAFAITKIILLVRNK